MKDSKDSINSKTIASTTESLEERSLSTAEEFSPLSLVNSILEKVDRVLYKKYIHRETKRMVVDSFEAALLDALNLCSLGLTLHLNCTPKDLNLENDMQLSPIPKDSLQI